MSDAPLEFSDLNFKLMVIEMLMYDEDEVIEPFSLRDYADEHGIELNDHIDETIEGALDYFRELEITPAMAATITELYEDAGNQIYNEIAFNWSGEDDRFRVRSLKDAAMLPNLESITLEKFDGVEGLDEVEARGVEVSADF